MFKYIIAAALMFVLFEASAQQEESAQCVAAIKTSLFGTTSLRAIQHDGSIYGPCEKIDRYSSTSVHCFPYEVSADRYICQGSGQMSSGDVCISFLPSSPAQAYLYGNLTKRREQIIKCQIVSN